MSHRKRLRVSKRDKTIIANIQKIVAEYESKYGHQPKSIQEEVDRLIWAALEYRFPKEFAEAGKRL